LAQQIGDQGRQAREQVVDSRFVGCGQWLLVGLEVSDVEAVTDLGQFTALGVEMCLERGAVGSCLGDELLDRQVS
jgi:hypothetical protein